jgi:hypothetical protein
MGRNLTFPGTVRSVVFMLSVIAVIVALHLLQRERERYASGEGKAFASGVIVGLALAVVGYSLSVSFKTALGGIVLLYPLGLLLAALGLIGLAVTTLAVGVVPRWGGVALITGNPLWTVLLLPILIYASTFYFSLVIWLLAGSWIVVGFAVFLATGRRTERPSRVR